MALESSEEAFGEASPRRQPWWWRAEVEWERMSVEEKAVWRARAKEDANTNQK